MIVLMKVRDEALDSCGGGYEVVLRLAWTREQIAPCQVGGVSLESVSTIVPRAGCEDFVFVLRSGRWGRGIYLD